MDLILAIDLMKGSVVHGAKGRRETYSPLTWGLSSSAEPEMFVSEIAPAYTYIADLDRIIGQGNHDREISACAKLVKRCYVDRGCRSPSENTPHDENIVNIVGTETGGDNLAAYENGFLSIDIKNGSVIPGGEKPVEMLARAENYSFDGCIILNIESVGTESGLSTENLKAMRESYSGTLFYGGGVSSIDDLNLLEEAGFDGAIIATALHRRKIPVEWIREGHRC